MCVLLRPCLLKRVPWSRSVKIISNWLKIHFVALNWKIFFIYKLNWHILSSPNLCVYCIACCVFPQIVYTYVTTFPAILSTYNMYSWLDAQGEMSSSNSLDTSNIYRLRTLKISVLCGKMDIPNKPYNFKLTCHKSVAVAVIYIFLTAKHQMYVTC